MESDIGEQIIYFNWAFGNQTWDMDVFFFVASLFGVWRMRHKVLFENSCCFILLFEGLVPTCPVIHCQVNEKCESL
jgi:hypothetical protein